MPKHRIDYGEGRIVDCDFTQDEMERRFSEVLRRCCRQPATFDLDTGQPFNGPQLSAAELRRRGYIE